MKMQQSELGTVISTLEGPSPGNVDFVVNIPEMVLHRGQFVEMSYSEGTLIAMIVDLIKTNRYFERADSVKEFEASGKKMLEVFPTAEWEYLIAKTKPLGVFSPDGKVKRTTSPISPGTKVRLAGNEKLHKFLGFDSEKGLHIGNVEFHDLPVSLNLSRLFQKHSAILAMSGAGKCISPSTKILFSNGEEQEIGSLVDEKLSGGFGVEDNVEFCVNNDTNFKVFSIDENNKIATSAVKAFCRRKAPAQMFRICTSTGKVLELTPEHFVPVLDESVKWIQANELKEGDYLLLPKPSIEGCNQTIELCHRSKIKQYHKVIEVDENFARLFAFLLAEGHNNGKMMSFTNNSPVIKKRLSELCIKVFGVEAKQMKRENELRIFNKNLALALQKIGFTNSSWTKFAPKELLLSKQNVINSFLSGLIDCDGYISKTRGLEICLASRKLIEALDSMILRCGIVSIKKEKTVKGKKYPRLFVNSAADLAILRGKLDLLIDYKKQNLEISSGRKPNTNIAVIPNVQKEIASILNLLNMSLSQTNSAGIANYLSRKERKDNPSFESLKKLIDSFEERVCLLESNIKETQELFCSLPNFSEQDAKQIISGAYGQFDFNQIARNSGSSSTTVRRIVRNITAPTKSAFVIAKQALMLKGEANADIDSITDMDFSALSNKIMNLCSSMGLETQKLCRESFLNKRYLYEVASSNKGGTYSHLHNALERLFMDSLQLEENVALAKKEIAVLKSLAHSGLYFDKIKKMEQFKPDFKYVYDLSVENRNFVANRLIIHNSYLVSVLIEELLKRKKESGRIAAIVFDVHGEYINFGEAITDSKHEDYSNKTKVVKARDIRIGVPKLSAAILNSIIPDLSSAQVRDVARIIESLRRNMQATGPFDFRDVKNAISADSEIKDSTKAALIGWISGLEYLNLFARTDAPSISDLISPGELTVIDFSDIVNQRKKQIIVSYFLRRLFDARRSKRIPPFVAVIEEAHQFAPAMAKEESAVSKGIIETIAREGRKFGASVCLISQRPKRLSTTALSQCNTHIILRITNPYDLKHIGESSEGLDQRSQDMISSQRVGEALIVGEATNYPVFVKIRERKSLESSHEIPLEKAALDFEARKEKAGEETEEFL